ncbi:MAG: TIGR00282 family metallophosphoesterase [Deltaproteobacteria bacterium]|nr:TIGR00282 family metallophosphoesterase [Deltaproteobacteria bacterium]
MGALRLLMIGDVAGKPGMRAVSRLLPRIVAERSIDLVVANGENAAGGLGLTPELARELLGMGVDVVTNGNHVWRQSEFKNYIGQEPRLLRPLNLPETQPGRGFGVFETPGGVKVGVVNLIGRVYMEPSDSPFTAADRALAALKGVKVVLVDFHAEATSEKRAMAYYLDGRVSAVIGTHTHVQTADEQIMEKGAAFLTDVGMTGPHDSVIGMRRDIIVDRFVTGMPHAFKLAKGGTRFQAAALEIDPSTGRAASIERIDIPLPD